ncbi:MAG: hypothetical protein WAV54_08545, partial [Acidimicrobiales bacterium]
SDLSDQLLVGVGFSAPRSDARRNSQQYVQGLLRWWTPLSKYRAAWYLKRRAGLAEEGAKKEAGASQRRRRGTSEKAEGEQRKEHHAQ